MGPYEVIRAPNASFFTGPGTNTYIVGTGPEVLVVDPGPSIASHLDAVERAVSGRGRARAVLLTHHHPDHAEGAAELAGRLGATLRGRRHQESPGLTEVSPGELVAFSGGALRVVFTPGHSSDHVCYQWEAAALIFVGDLVAERGFIIVDPPDGNMIDYLESLSHIGRVAGDTHTLLPGHGDPITDAAAHLDRYIEHRLARESKVMRALDAQGAATEAELLPVVYDDTPVEVHPVAARSLLAHLLKLEHQGRISARRGAGPTEYRRR